MTMSDGVPETASADQAVGIESPVGLVSVLPPIAHRHRALLPRRHAQRHNDTWVGPAVRPRIEIPHQGLFHGAYVITNPLRHHAVYFRKRALHTWRVRCEAQAPRRQQTKSDG